MDNKIFINALAFSIGAAVGSVVTWALVKTKYEKIAKEEIDSVREVYAKKATILENEIKKAHEYEKVKDKAQTYESVVNDQGYKAKNIHVISPESFGELNYDTVSLTYYADHVLANDFDEVVEDIDDMVGLDSLKTFGEYEDDSVFVRNDDMKTDFEILLDTRNYADVVGEIGA